jgi:hypothetical protein
MEPMIIFSAVIASALGFFVAAAIFVYVYSVRNGVAAGKIGGGGGHTTLPIPNMKRNETPWYISHIGSSAEAAWKVRGKELVVDFKRGISGSGSGGAFKANPWKKLPSEYVVLGYEVYFPPDFEWTQGGKLPGVCFGKRSGECSTGGDWQNDQGSVRIMWKDGGHAIAYSYLAIRGGNAKAFEVQGSEYKRQTHATGRTGHATWKSEASTRGLMFKKGAWNTVTLSLTLNTPGKKNGIMDIVVNGVQRRLQDVVYRESDDVKFNSVLIVSFFGGSWSSPKDTYAKFRNFRFATTP